ncbi:MAG: DNA-processing protein DprA [Gemmatimonadota bacterium]
MNLKNPRPGGRDTAAPPTFPVSDVPLASSELEPLLRLALIEGVGPHRLALLIDHFGSAPAAIAASSARLRALPGIGSELARRIRAAGAASSGTAARHALERMKRVEAIALTSSDPEYPAAIRNLNDAPYLLFAAGDIDVLRQPSIAMVGTRTPSAYGLEAAETLSYDLAAAGFTIVSGLARGIDSAAHRGALEAGSATIGVLGHGIEMVYPPENRRLFGDVRRQGLLLTEYPPGETPKSGNFPRRNRLISALAEAVVVVEMGHQSGAQHTVNYALDQGKEVMAVPGPIGSQRSEGTNQLIKDGAPLVTTARDILEVLRGVGFEPVSRAAPPPAGQTDRSARNSEPASAASLLTEIERQLLGSLSTHPAHIDSLLATLSLAPAEASAALLHLELRGLVESLPGNRFRAHGRGAGSDGRTRSGR